METHLRSILKAVTYRATGSVVTFLIAWVVGGEMTLAIKMGLLDPVVKIGVFYIHERMWHRVGFGKIRLPEYEI